MGEQLYVYRWDRHGRKGRLCRVTARGKMNSCRVEFSDGYKMITSRNALKKSQSSEPRYSRISEPATASQTRQGE